jgi:hypothetical protein
VLALEILRAVLADDVDAGLDQHRHVLERHVLRGRDDRDVAADVGADPLVGRADVLRRRSRSPPAAR